MSSVLAPPRQNFQRQWYISLQPQGADDIVISSDQSDQPLQVTFDVRTFALMEYWEADVSIFNLSSLTTGTLLNNSGLTADNFTTRVYEIPAGVQIGTPISISAGYKNAPGGPFSPQANLIYQGNVFQPMWTRENVVDARLRLRCFVGLLQNTFNYASGTVAKGLTAYDQLQQIAGASDPPIPVDIDDKAKAQLQAKTFPRGRPFAGRPVPLIQQIVRDNNLIAWLAPNGLNVRSMEIDQTKEPQYIFGPPLAANTQSSSQTPGSTPITRTLLGVPQQTQQGIIFRVLMDARPKLGDVVQIAPGTAINQLPVQIPSLPPAPNPSRKYVVVGIRHYGVARGRGDDWFTEVTGVTLDFFPAYFIARDPSASASPAK
jgi:hypothetical protein